MSKSSRRQFLGQVAGASLAVPLVGPLVVRSSETAASDKVQIGCIGVGGKGQSDMMETSVGHHIVAICDVDEQRLAAAAQRFPQAKTYTDWRKLLEQKDIDAVTVSTPDHMHAAISLAAIDLGKHAFTQKPLTHTVWEARRLTEAAAEQKVVTQMGIQHHATSRLKTAVQLIQDGAIGRVSEVHTWTDRPGTFWKQGQDRPSSSDVVPSHLHWDLWLGNAPERPYVAGAYHPFHWRGWWDFGTGALGDMGCHILDPVVNALALSAPQTIWAEGPEPHPESGPTWCIVHYEFAGTDYTAASLKLTWYEAGKQPPRERFQAPDDWPGSDNGVLFVGERGNLFVGFPENPQLFPVESYRDYPIPEIADHNHYTEWTSAIVGNGKTSCPFSYSGPLTETVLLGNVAYRTGKRLEWDSAQLKATNVPEADSLIHRDYRAGWQLTGG